MPSDVEVPEEAVVAAAKARHGRILYEHWADVGGERRERLLEEARLDLQEAAPAIRKQAIEEERERLRGLARWVGNQQVVPVAALDNQEAQDA